MSSERETSVSSPPDLRPPHPLLLSLCPQNQRDHSSAMDGECVCVRVTRVCNILRKGLGRATTVPQTASNRSPSPHSKTSPHPPRPPARLPRPPQRTNVTLTSWSLLFWSPCTGHSRPSGNSVQPPINTFQSTCCISISYPDDFNSTATSRCDLSRRFVTSCAGTRFSVLLVYILTRHVVFKRFRHSVSVEQRPLVSRARHITPPSST